VGIYRQHIIEVESLSKLKEDEIHIKAKESYEKEREKQEIQEKLRRY